MYSFSLKLANIYNFQLKNEQIVYLTNDGLFNKALYINDVKLFENKVSNFVFDGKNIVFSVWDSDIYIVNINDLLPKQLLQKSSFGNIPNSNSEILVSKHLSNERWIYDFINKIFLVKVLLPPALKIGNQLYFYKSDKHTIQSTIINGNEWETTINRNGKILSLLGIYENVLVVCLQFGNAYGLMGLDIQTGEILWNRDDWGLLQGHHTTMQNGKIFSLKGGTFSDSYYLEADISTVSLLRFGEVPNLKKHGFSVFNYTLNENFIYFTANKLSISEATIIGVLAYDSLELLWWQEVELENGAFLAQKPQVDGDKLYILDTGGTLHIFEKEQST